MPELPDRHAVKRGFWTSLSLKSKFAAHMVLTLIIIGVLGGVMLAGYWREYAQLSQSREYVRLAVLLAELGETATAETRAPMFALLYAEHTPLQQPKEELVANFVELSTATDAKLGEARELWKGIDKEGIDEITLARIDEIFVRADKLTLWRRPVMSAGRDLPEEIEKSEAFTSRLSHHLELGMPRTQARCQALWDLVKDGCYAELTDYTGSALLYVSRVTRDASMARSITLHSELLRYHGLVDRENGLVAYLISKGARRHGLLSDDIGWLRSLWDRQTAAYMNIWSLAPALTRQRVQEKLAIEGYPRVAAARRWLAANWTNNDMANWKDTDVAQISTPELVQDLEYTRDFEALHLMRDLRAELLEDAANRIRTQVSVLVFLSIAWLFGCILVGLGFWWLDRHVFRRVWNLSLMVQQIHGTGDVSLRTPVHHGDEVGELEESFNEMMEAMEANHRNLEAARSVLETRVRERTAEVGQRLAEVERLNRELGSTLNELRNSRDQSERYASRLEEANVQLTSANQELESFIHSASHDLRTPLRNIVGFIELLRLHSEGRFDDAATHRIGVVLSEAKRLSSLIDGLLAFFRVGRAELRMEQVYIGSLVRELRSDLVERQEGRSILWKVGDMPACVGDRELLKQLMGILLDNAIKFTARTAEAVIEIGALQSGGASDELVYFVRDNGAGFNPRYSEKLFRVFERLHKPRDFDGNGIGLANMKRIVVRHGGRVWAEGAIDKGACFYFALPLRPRVAQPPEGSPSGAEARRA